MDDPVEIFLANRAHVCIGGWIEEVDRVWDSTLHRELNGVQVVAQHATKSESILLNAFAQRRSRWWRIALHIALVMRRLGVVLHDMDFFLPHDIAAVVLLELHSALQGHAKVTGLVVVVEELLGCVDFVNMLPSTAGIGLQES